MSNNEGPHETATTGADVAPTGTAQQSGGGGEPGEADPARKRRRRGSRGGRNRSKPKPANVGGGQDTSGGGGTSSSDSSGSSGGADSAPAEDKGVPPGAPAKPKIGDTLPPPPASSEGGETSGSTSGQSGRGGQARSEEAGQSGGSGGRRRRGRGGSGSASGDSGQQSGQKDGQATGEKGQNDQRGQGDQKAQKGQKGQKGGGKDTQKSEGTSGAITRKDQKGQKSQKSGQDQQDRKAGADGNGRSGADGDGQSTSSKRRRRRRRGGGAGGGGQQANQPVEAVMSTVSVDEEELEKARETKSKGRYSMVVHVSEKAAQIATLEGRSMIEHYVSRPSDDVSQIHGNIYLGRVQNVLPGMEAAFVDIGTPKNAVLYRGDVHYDKDDVERASQAPRIEKLLKAGQTIVCQVTKNPIGAKGARLTQEVSLPGRYVVLLPNSSTYGISKRLPDNERKRLRQVLDRTKPEEHGIIVRTAAEGASSEEIANDVRGLVKLWEQIDGLAKRSKAPSMLYREPDMTLRTIREEFNQDFRSVVIDDRKMYEDVRDYVASISPDLAARVEFYDPKKEKLPLFERYHVHEQLHRALDRKVWLPSGGSLIIEKTEALTVIDVNTGKNVGRSSLEETVFKNNLEAAVEIARQLRLRDIGGIIVIDYIDMEKRDNRDEVVRVFREALARDKTRTQVFEISDLGLCEMTRKRIGEGLLESYSSDCPVCEGRGYVLDKELLPE